MDGVTRSARPGRTTLGDKAPGARAIAHDSARSVHTTDL